MTEQQRRAAAEEIAAEIVNVVSRHTTSSRDDEAIWTCGPEDLPLPGEDDIAAILARHDTATVGDAVKEIASRLPFGRQWCERCESYDHECGCYPADINERNRDNAAAVIQRAISASERELVEVAWSLVNNLPDSELELARENWGNTNVAVVKHWRDEVRAVLAKRGRK